MRVRLPALALLLAAAPALGEPIVFSIPPGRPTAVQLEGSDSGFTVNAEVLGRYGFTLDQYNAMPSGDRDRVDDWIRVFEKQRRRAAAQSAAQPASPVSKVDEAALERIRKAAGATRFFDVSGRGDGSELSLTPSVEVFGAGTLRPDGSSTPGGLRRFTLTAPGGLKLEGGNLGLDGRSPLVEPSPYFGLGESDSGETKHLDYDWKAQGYAVGLGARLYTDDAPGLDARIDQGVASLRTLSPAVGVKPGDVDTIQSNLAFSSDFERQWLFYGSALGRVGRAYSLMPNVDLGWSTMAVMRWSGYFPNATLDQTAGLRVTPKDGQHVGVFGGVTEALGLFDRTVISDSVNDESFKTHVHVDAAPHADLAAWGKMPYLSNATYSLSAGRQWNPWTTLTTVAGSVEGGVGGEVRVGAFGRYSDESGPDIEFSRTKAAAGVTVAPNPGLQFFAQYQRDSARFGTAQIDSQGVFLGATLTETKGPAKGESVTLESLLGGQEQLLDVQTQSDFVKDLQRDLDGFLALEAALAGLGASPDVVWDGVKSVWGNLSPASQQALQDLWAQYNPGAPPLNDVFKVTGADVQTLNKLAELLTDTQILERVMVRAVRSQILQKLESVSVPGFGKLRLSAPLVLAAANAYALGLTPLPPVTAKDQETLDSFLLQKLAGKLDCPNVANATDATDCLVGKIPPDVKKQLENVYGAGSLPATLKAAVDWPSGVLRREINRMALQVILAAETLDELSVDKGEKIGQLNKAAVMKSFDRLDRRRRSDPTAALKSAARDLKAELDAQDAALRRKLDEYGAARLAWLEAQPAWPSNVQIAVQDWPQLLAMQGDAKLFDLILRCKAALLAAHPNETARLLIRLDNNPLGASSLTRGAINVLGLPPRPVDLSALELRF